MADIFITLILLGITALIISSIIKRHKKGGCSGNCSCCGGCGHHKNNQEDKH